MREPLGKIQRWQYIGLTILEIVGLDLESEQQQESGSGRQVQKRAGTELHSTFGSLVLLVRVC